MKKSELAKLPDNLVKEAESLKEQVIELSEVKYIMHSFNFDLQLPLYQRQGIRWLVDSRKYKHPCHLADERGLSKRTQILVYLQNLTGCSLLLVRKKDLYYWLSIIGTSCPDFVTAVHSGEPCDAKENQLVITTYGVAVQSAYLLSVNWNSLIFDNLPHVKEFDQKGKF